MAYVKVEELRETLYESDTITFRGLAIIDNFPTADVVEVVRCMNCGMSRETEDERYLFCMQFADTVDCQAFCSYGVRK